VHDKKADDFTEAFKYNLLILLSRCWLWSQDWFAAAKIEILFWVDVIAVACELAS